jgi:hypothetical protein
MIPLIDSVAAKYVETGTGANDFQFAALAGEFRIEARLPTTVKKTLAMLILVFIFVSPV